MPINSQKILDRINEIKSNMRHHENHIILLKAYIKGLTLEGDLYTDSAINYKRTKEDDVYSRHSINNLKEQIKLCKFELAILKEYSL